MTSQSRPLRSQSQKIVEFVKFALCFFNCESTCDLTDVPASIYDRKINARPFDIGRFQKDILRCLSLVRFLLKDRNSPLWRKREPTHMRLSGTDRLKFQDELPGQGLRRVLSRIFRRFSSKVWTSLKAGEKAWGDSLGLSKIWPDSPRLPLNLAQLTQDPVCHPFSCSTFQGFKLILNVKLTR